VAYARGVRDGRRGGSPWAEFYNNRTDQVSRVCNALLDIVNGAFAARNRSNGLESRDCESRFFVVSFPPPTALIIYTV